MSITNPFDYLQHKVAFGIVVNPMWTLRLDLDDSYNAAR